jgi:hypothetical protein
MTSPILEFPTYPSEGFLLDEDRALRDLMKGVVVSDYENATRNVEAWFGHPDQELREQKYPYITVDLLGIQEGKERVHRGDYYVADPQAWWQMTPLTGTQVGYLMEMPTPVDLDYQISTWARNPRHDRQILMQLITGGRTMLRGGLLTTADKKIRRLDFLGHQKRDSIEDGKRLFNNIFRMRVSSEVPWGVLGRNYYTYGETTSVHIGVKGYLADMGVVVDETTIVVGEVEAWYPEDRTSDLLVDGEQASRVRSSRGMYEDSLQPGDLVAVTKEALVESPAGLSDYALVVLGLEKSVAQEELPVP